MSNYKDKKNKNSSVSGVEGAASGAPSVVLVVLWHFRRRGCGPRVAVGGCRRSHAVGLLAKGVLTIPT